MHAHHSDENAEAINLDKENTKMDKYKDWNIHVIPFAVEATGRFGPSALKFI
jgi:hypothetical protein